MKTTKPRFDLVSLHKAEQRYLDAAQEFYDELCRASQSSAEADGVVLGSFATVWGCAKKLQRLNLFIVVGFGPMTYHGMRNMLASSPDGAWTAWLRTVSPSGKFTRDKNLYQWYHTGTADLFQAYPGHRNVKPVRKKVDLALLEQNK